MADFKFENRIPTVKAVLNNQTQLLVRLMVEDIHQKSVKKTPYKDGGLRAMVAKQMIGNKGIIEWKAPYAEYQEDGMRKDGTRVVRNYTTPGTQAHYAEDSVKEVMENISDYLTKVGIK